MSEERHKGTEAQSGRGKLNILIEADDYLCTITVNGIRSQFTRLTKEVPARNSTGIQWQDHPELNEELAWLMEHQFSEEFAFDVMEVAESLPYKPKEFLKEQPKNEEQS